jgi:hypothetical protein
MRPIAGTIEDIAEKLRQLNLPKGQGVIVSFADTSVLEALKDLQSEAARNPISDADLMDELRIDAAEFEDLIGHPPKK